MQTITGLLKWAPEIRFTPSGKTVASLVITVIDKDVNCNAWEELAEYVDEHYEEMRPGTRISVTGYWKDRRWTDRNGDTQTRREFVIKAWQ